MTRKSSSSQNARSQPRRPGPSGASLLNVAAGVTAQTRIATSYGMLTAQELYEQFSQRPREPLELLTLGGAARLTAAEEVCDAPALSVVTKRQHRLDIGYHQRVLTVDRRGELVLQPANQLNRGDWICLQGRQGQFGAETLLPAVSVPRRTAYKHLDLPANCNEAVASFLGLYLAEGWTHFSDGTVAIVLADEQDPQLANLAEEMLRTCFGDRLRVSPVRYERYQDQRRFLISSVDLATRLRQWAPGDSHSRRLPTFVFRWPLALQAALLRWMFEGDGSVKRNGSGYDVTYASASEGLARDVALLLGNLGIRTTLSSERRTGYEGVYCCVRLFSNDSRENFSQHIGYITAKDAETATRGSAMPYDRRVIPWQAEPLQTLLPYVLGQTKEKCRECVREHRRVRLNPDRLDAILAALDEDAVAKDPVTRRAAAHLRRLQSLELEYQEVESVQCLDESHAFAFLTSGSAKPIISAGLFWVEAGQHRPRSRRLSAAAPASPAVHGVPK